MKRISIFTAATAACLIAFVMMSSFMMIPSASASKALTLNRSEPIHIFGTITSADGTTYYGPVTLSGAINASGTFVMPSQLIGMALHCTFVLKLPNGNITIRMNCNMVTFNGRWKILEGTGAYQNLKGEGSLVMPNDNDEILDGIIHGM